MSQSKVDDSVFLSEIQINEYDLVCYDRKRHRRGVACHIKTDLSYNVKSYFIR